MLGLGAREIEIGAFEHAQRGHGCALRRCGREETFEHRAYALAATWFVDGIVVFQNKRLTAEILALKPDVYCKAGDYTLEKLDPDERRALEQVGAQITFMPFLPGYSTTNLIVGISGSGAGLVLAEFVDPGDGALLEPDGGVNGGGVRFSG